MSRKSREQGMKFGFRGQANTPRIAGDPPRTVRVIADYLEKLPDGEMVDMAYLAAGTGYGTHTLREHVAHPRLTQYRTLAPPAPGRPLWFGNRSTIKAWREENGVPHAEDASE